MVLEKVIDILAEYKECDANEIHEDSTLEELELDSLDTVDLMMTFEDEFGIQMEMSEDIKTVGDSNRRTDQIVLPIRVPDCFREPELQAVQKRNGRKYIFAVWLLHSLEYEKGNDER